MEAKLFLKNGFGKNSRLCSYILAFFLIQAAVYVCIQAIFNPFLVTNRGPCINLVNSRESALRSIFRIADFIEKYGSVRILKEDMEDWISINELTGIESCSSNDIKLKNSFGSELCVIFPGNNPCISDVNISDTKRFEIVRNLLSIPKCKGHTDLVIDENSRGLELLDKFQVYDSELVTKEDSRYAIINLNRLVGKEVPSAVIYDDDGLEAAGYSTRGIIWRRSRHKLFETIRKPLCAEYGLVGTDVSSRFILDVHNVKKVLCHIESSCEYMESLGYETYPLRKLLEKR